MCGWGGPWWRGSVGFCRVHGGLSSIPVLSWAIFIHSAKISSMVMAFEIIFLILNHTMFMILEYLF